MMRIKRNYLTSLIFLLSLIIIWISGNLRVDAAVSGPQIDTDGSVTATAGATYYNVTTWQEIFDTYKTVVPDASSKNTVFLNVTGDVPGSNIVPTGQAVIEGKSLTILGNGHTIYLDNDTNYSTGSGGAGGGSVKGGFKATGNISNATVLTVENATILNNITGGIFQAVGNAAAPTSVYKNITTKNGDNRGAQPIRNDRGKILFYGNNTFNILQNQNFEDISNSGYDNQGEWVQGATWIEVVDGTTTLNQSWGTDQPIYGYNTTSETLKVNDGANLVWNLNKTYTMYYDDYTSGPLNWIIEDNASFKINGTINTATNFSGGWWMWLTMNSWNFTVGKNSQFIASTGGGAINLDGFSGGPVNWNFSPDSQVLFNNLNPSQSLIKGKPGGTSGILLNDPSVVTLNTVGGSIFDKTVQNFPINIKGNGLRTHSSANMAIFGENFDLRLSNMEDLNSSDIWYRQNTGTITGLGSTSVNSNLIPNNYTTADLVSINKSKYLSWYKPIGIWVNRDDSAMGRTFNIDLGTLPLDNVMSKLISGVDTQTLVVGDDRGQHPNYTVTVTMMNNEFPNQLQYYWVDPESKSNTQLILNTAVSIATVTDDNDLPSYVTMGGAGNKYALSFAKETGLNIRANNSLVVQSNTSSGLFKYSINDGPTA
ncbi:hypothetical protein [Bacillus thuringiensis]|uniref:hypothetical protein n=1 Tax=Bacillus thuringiensis TaxID=1428 RepID=UPI001CA5DB57|nr:hypothetical protein [Bacillus thuringiensis]